MNLPLMLVDKYPRTSCRKYKWINLLLIYASIFPQLFWQTAVKFAPQLWRPAGGVLMINDMISTHAISEEDAPCSMALCRDDYHLYMLSASGGNVSFFTMMTDKVNLTN